MSTLDRCLRAIPDDHPGLVDLRGLLLSGRCELFADEDGFVARSLDFPFAGGAGRPGAETILHAVERASAAGTAWAGEGSEEEWHLLVGDETVPAVESALSDWPRRGVTLHTRAAAVPPPPVDAPIELAADGWRAAGLDLGHLPDDLRRELASDWVASRPLAAAMIEGRVAATCYAPLVTERYWDVAVDTLAPYRRRGLAAACFEALARSMDERFSLEPVWGALDDNGASLALAAKLGFEPVHRLTSFVLRSGASS